MLHVADDVGHREEEDSEFTAFFLCPDGILVGHNAFTEYSSAEALKLKGSLQIKTESVIAKVGQFVYNK